MRRRRRRRRGEEEQRARRRLRADCFGAAAVLLRHRPCTPAAKRRTAAPGFNCDAKLGEMHAE